MIGVCYTGLFALLTKKRKQASATELLFSDPTFQGNLDARATLRSCVDSPQGCFYFIVLIEKLSASLIGSGTPARFYSSEAVARGFCDNSGTPLFFHNEESERISISIRCLDMPEKICLAFELGIEGKRLLMRFTKWRRNLC